MKVTQEQKDETRKLFIKAAVEVISEKGFRGATMREIARQAGMGEATIYNYFPTKEKLVFGYYYDLFERVGEEAGKVPDIETYTFREQLQLLADGMFRHLQGDRTFVEKTFSAVFISPVSYLGDTAELRSAFASTIIDLIDSAVEAGEMPEVPFKQVSAYLMWDYFVMMIGYWLKDRSEGFASTAALTDKSLSVLETIFTSGIIPQAVDLGSYIVRSALSGWLDPRGGGRHPSSKKRKPQFAS